METYIALGASFFALILAIFSLVSVFTLNRHMPTVRTYAKLRAELDDLSEQVDTQARTIRRMRSKYDARIRRSRSSDDDPDQGKPEDVDAWKRRKRQELKAKGML